MPIVHQSEAIVLRTWPFGEADLIVAIFTRDEGIVRGVARHAMRSRKRFGGALEPMTQVRATWAERPRQDLVRLDSLEILWSPLREPVDYPRATALAVVAEVLEAALPDHAQEDDIYRLALAVIKHLHGAPPYLAITYFLLWISRLLGWLPELQHCALTGEPFKGNVVYFSANRDGLFTAGSRPAGSLPLSAESLRTALSIFRNPLTAFSEADWPRTRAVDLRRFAASVLERHLEERLISLRTLARL